MLYVTSPWLIYFVTESLYLWPPVPFCPPSTPCFWQPPAHSLNRWTGNFFFFNQQITQKSEIIWYLSLPIWLISLSILPSTSIHIANARLPFFMTNISLCMYVCVYVYLCIYIYIHTYTPYFLYSIHILMDS